MSEHLPECPLGQPCQSGEPDHVMQGTIAGIPVTICGLCMDDCICPSLRACEQRVKEKYADVPAIWNDGFEHGLYAARKAVGDLPHPMIDVECECGACAALAAIDALREKP